MQGDGKREEGVGVRPNIRLKGGKMYSSLSSHSTPPISNAPQTPGSQFVGEKIIEGHDLADLASQVGQHKPKEKMLDDVNLRY